LARLPFAQRKKGSFRDRKKEAGPGKDKNNENGCNRRWRHAWSMAERSTERKAKDGRLFPLPRLIQV
jgi:hypothetical protein